MSKYNYIYKTTNNINGRFYIGVHSTDKLIDGYIGCGISRHSDAVRASKKSRFLGFAKAVAKYGYDNFSKEILYFFKTKEEAYYFESKIVNHSFIKNRDNYNIKLGGLCAPSPKGIKRTKKFKKERSVQIRSYMSKLIDIHSKEYVVVNIKNNSIYNIKNLSKFCKENNLSEHSLSAVSRGISRIYNKTWWICKKEEWTGDVLIRNNVKEPIKGSLVNASGDIIYFNSLKEASDITKIDKSSISKLLRGIFKKCNGWRVAPMEV